MDVFSIVISVVAFILSIVVFFQSIRVQSKQMNIDLFDKRFELLNFYIELCGNSDRFFNKNRSEAKYILTRNYLKIDALFKKDIANDLKVINQDIANYLDTHQFPDYISEAESLLTEYKPDPTNKEAAFYFLITHKIKMRFQI